MKLKTIHCVELTANFKSALLHRNSVIAHIECKHYKSQNLRSVCLKVVSYNEKDTIVTPQFYSTIKWSRNNDQRKNDQRKIFILFLSQTFGFQKISIWIGFFRIYPRKNPRENFRLGSKSKTIQLETYFLITIFIKNQNTTDLDTLLALRKKINGSANLSPEPFGKSFRILCSKCQFSTT